MLLDSTFLNKAIQIAAAAHAGQMDKGGQPYILHPLRVMSGCIPLEQKIVAVLHDTVEDSCVTLDELRDEFGDEIADAIDCLTRRKGEDYETFIDRIAANDLARAVKIRDIRDNMDLSRLGREPTEQDRKRQDKYLSSLSYLYLYEELF